MKNMILVTTLTVVIILTTVLLIFKISNETPKDQEHKPIYCLMVTGKDHERYEMALKSINNFLEQDYKDKFLVIVNHGEPLALKNKSVFEILVNKEKHGLTLGDMRNIALSVVPFNAYWITWDDDDFRRPDMLSAMHQIATKSNADVVTLTKRLEFNKNTHLIWKMIVANGMVIALCKVLPNFSYLRKESLEDVHLLQTYRNNGAKIVVYDNDPKLYIRLVHTNNTSLYVTKNKRYIIKSQNKNYIEKEASKEERQFVQNIINVYFNNAAE